MKTAQQIFDAAFATERSRDPRSAEYRAGVWCALQRRESGEHKSLAKLRPPYQLGTAQCDAWFSGVNEGIALWRDATKEPKS